MKLSARERVLIILVVVAGILVLGYHFGVAPALRAAEEAGTNLGTEIAAAGRLLAKASGIMARRAQAAEAVATARRAFPADREADLGGLTLLALVEKTAAAAGLDLEAKGLGPVRTGDGPPKVSVEIHGSGTSRAVVGFLHGLGNARYRCDLDSLELMAGEGHELEVRAVVTTLLPGAEGGRRDD